MVGPDADNFAARNGGDIVEAGYFKLSGLNFSNIPLPDDLEVVACFYLDN